MVISERSDATNGDGFIHGTKRTTSCVRITSATTTRVARTQKSLGSKSSRFDRCTTEATVMDEGPKSGRPGRPGEELVRGASSLTSRSSCTEAEAGLRSSKRLCSFAKYSHVAFLLFLFHISHYRRLRRTSSSEGSVLLATACGVPDRLPRHTLSSWL
jgi:hypothetical protein